VARHVAQNDNFRTHSFKYEDAYLHFANGRAFPAMMLFLFLLFTVVPIV
jgi:hypothetical protein